MQYVQRIIILFNLYIFLTNQQSNQEWYNGLEALVPARNSIRREKLTRRDLLLNIRNMIIRGFLLRCVVGGQTRFSRVSLQRNTHAHYCLSRRPLFSIANSHKAQMPRLLLVRDCEGQHLPSSHQRLHRRCRCWDLGAVIAPLNSNQSIGMSSIRRVSPLSFFSVFHSNVFMLQTIRLPQSGLMVLTERYIRCRTVGAKSEMRFLFLLFGLSFSHFRYKQW